jgi:hypothetical protein
VDISVALFLLFAGALFLLLIASSSARAVFTDALLHPMSPSRIDRSNGAVRVVRGDDAQV